MASNPESYSRSETGFQRSRSTGISLTSLFFVFGVLASGASFLMLLFPGTPLDVLWRLNPSAHAGLVGMGWQGRYVMFMVCVSCAFAAVGLWRCKRWGLWVAIYLLAGNFVGNTIQFFWFGDW
jgi:hypothetical protein